MNDQELMPYANGGPADTTAPDTSPLRRIERDVTAPNTETAIRRANRPGRRRIKRFITLAVGAVVLIGAAAAFIVTRPWAPATGPPVQSVRYLGLYEPGAPASYTGIDQFAQAIGRQPNIVSYYNPWLKPFQAGFARSAASRGAMTLVQLDPTNVSLAKIAAGQYDAYLRSYATATEDFGGQVIMSFGHEMNGYWYSWGNLSTSPAVFVAAWRHVVTLFRAAGAGNVTWLWAVNVTDHTAEIPDPARWWPGGSYVSWVGIDGYYDSPSSSFAQVFGPTIVDVRSLTKDPIFISETGVKPAAGQQAKIADLFAGIRAYGLLGFLWFDENYSGADWRISTSSAFAAFRQQAKAFFRPQS
jgi:mannan endo-1,4-beta-mannosidase